MVLSGEGADELFWGYPHWKRVLTYQNISDKYLPNFILKLSLISVLSVNTLQINQKNLVSFDPDSEGNVYVNTQILKDREEDNKQNPSDKLNSKECGESNMLSFTMINSTKISMIQ